jgi:hypothetical protein
LRSALPVGFASDKNISRAMQLHCSPQKEQVAVIHKQYDFRDYMSKEHSMEMDATCAFVLHLFLSSANTNQPSLLEIATTCAIFYSFEFEFELAQKGSPPPYRVPDKDTFIMYRVPDKNTFIEA